jgi:N-acetyl-gamma-glutamyl-phosphate reductase common form
VNARVGIVGGRGYTGAELLKLLAGHPRMELAFASSGSQAGQPVTSACPSWPNPEDTFVRLELEDVASRSADAWVLAVPNGVAARWAEAIHAAEPDAIVLDLSADHRFDDNWVYGLPERYRERIIGARSIANPGCYATGAQLALLPLLDCLTGTPCVFGVSGYSGAGKTPSPRNDPDRLADNLIPYSLSGHVHEREISAQLGRDVRFMPHVAAFFRGISLTVAATLDRAIGVDELFSRYQDFYANEPMVRVCKEIPELRDVRGGPRCHLGGLCIDEREPRRVTLVSVLDNLAKGAATQALQNLNLALGLPESEGLIE